MNRRDLLKLISAATGTAMIGGTGVLAGCAIDGDSNASPAYRFNDDDVLWLDEVAETILPRTDTPGAKDAQVGQFMTVFVNDCYTPEQQGIFHNGMDQLDARAQQEYGSGFMSLSPEQRTELVRTLDREAKTVAAAGGKPHYFTMLKQLTLFGFFTSKVGGTQALRFIAIPGRYDGEMPYEEGDRAWATT
ncbi:gluconate 2-dehydrogenase subunit 3 family protein [Marinimicrobium sp. ARAG 43.8]|uniref:gluconate 2-dehydrogenase subunit 3 family protein n=1 Tax=Marinimicrobium sp. ARAG 43.8 TaxID=3418719 RepID=UPI003CFB8D3C